MICPRCFHNSVHKKLTQTEQIEVCPGSLLRVVVPKCHCDNCGYEYLDDMSRNEVIQAVLRDRHREDLASYAHEAWTGWMQYLFDKSFLDVETGAVTIPADLVERWKRQMSTPFEKLPKHEQASDLAEADKMLAILEGC